MGNIVRGWKPASKLSKVPVRSLRKAVLEDRTLAAQKGPDGIWSFVDSDLLAFAAAIGKAVPKAPTTVVNATTAMPSTSVPAVAPTALGAVTSGWLLAAATPVSARVDDEDDDAGAGHEPPFWAASSAPMYPDGEPVVDPVTRVITYMRVASNAPGNHAPGTLGAFVAELQQQVADARAQLAATTTAWRHQRVAAIAAEITVEAIMGGAMLQVVPAVRDAAHAAVAALTDTELRREDGYPQAVARGAAMGAAQQIGMSIARAQAQQAPWPLPPDPNDQLSRMRLRRRARR